MAHSDSLREIYNGLACCLGNLRHLGILKSPKRSTLSYANEHRPAALDEELFWSTLSRFRSQKHLGCRKKFRFKNKLLSFDFTTISPCLALLPWADFNRAKSGVKVHVLLDHHDYMPAFVRITQTRRHYRPVARLLRLTPASIVSFDRAYNDYVLFARWTNHGVYFVNSMKENAVFEVIEERQIPRNHSILSDQIIRLTGVKAKDKCAHLPRRIVVWDDTNQCEIVFLTNHLKFAAPNIAAVYKDRWEIEIFFRTL
jgi:hypothetical protein